MINKGASATRKSLMLPRERSADGGCTLWLSLLKKIKQRLLRFNVGITGVVTQTVVPVPAAAWLFASALLGMVGIKRKH